MSMHTADMFALGVALHRMVTGAHLFKGCHDIRDVLDQMSRGVVLPNDPLHTAGHGCSAWAVHFVVSLLQPNQYSRPTAARCLSHPWLQVHTLASA